MDNYKALRAAAAGADGTAVVNRLDLAELLQEYDYLRAAAGTKAEAKYSPEFEEAWAQYPSRPGNSKAAAYKAWKSRIKAGATPEEMIAGTIKYAAYCKARNEPQYIKMAATFYGPGEHFSADWTVQRAPVPRRTELDRRSIPSLDDARQRASEEAKARLRGQQPPRRDDDDGMTIDMVPA